MDQHIPITKMMDGGADYTFGYPAARGAAHGTGVARLRLPGGGVVVTALALLVGAIGLWLLLPIGWRSGATAVMLGFPFLPDYARLAYPAIIAMVFLIPVVVRWPTIASGDRLARRTC